MSLQDLLYINKECFHVEDKPSIGSYHASIENLLPVKDNTFIYTGVPSVAIISSDGGSEVSYYFTDYFCVADAAIDLVSSTSLVVKNVVPQYAYNEYLYFEANSGDYNLSSTIGTSKSWIRFYIIRYTSTKQLISNVK